MDEVIQGTPEWAALRAGKVTASRVSDIIARTKTGYSTSRANYLAQLVAERLTGTPAETFSSPAMQWGTDTEPAARGAYEFMRDAEVIEVGFVHHPTIAMSGASPDGLVGEDGLVEIKAPLTATHLDTLLGQSVPSKYVTQMQWQMASTGRRWCDFASFDPRLPATMQLFVKRVHRDDVMIASIEKEVRAFLAELDDKIETLLRIYGRQENMLAAG